MAIVLLGTSVGNAGVGWKVVPLKDNQFALENIEDKGLRHKIRSQGPPPLYMGQHNVKKQPVALLVYFAGSAGTGDVVDIYRTLLFNTKSKKFYGDFPFRVESSIPGRSWPDTVFTFRERNFTVEDASSGFKRTLKY